MSLTTILKLIPYFVILLLIIAALWFWKAKDDAQANLIAAQSQHITDVAVHTEDAATIKQLFAYKEANDAVTAVFISRVDALDGKLNSFNSTLDKMRRSNAEVDQYLSQNIPLPLAGLLNGLCDPAACPK